MVPHFPPLHIGAAFSGLAFSVAPAVARGCSGRSRYQQSRTGRRWSAGLYCSIFYSRVVCCDAVTSPDVPGRQPSTFPIPTTLALQTESGKVGNDDGVEYVMQRCGTPAMLAQHSHRVQQAGAWRQQRGYMVISRQPRIRRLDMRSMVGHGGGGTCFRVAVKTISFVLSRYLEWLFDSLS